MPRVSTKENKNPYMQAREGKGWSRERASEMLEVIPEDAIEKIENERRKPHPDEVVVMAEKYGNPELCNYFCSNECDIGRIYVPEVKITDLSRIILEMLASLNSMSKRTERLIDISSDGQIVDAELDDFIDIQENLEKISITIETLQLWAERMVAEGKINGEEYQRKKKERSGR